jgi:hypothetical protein
MEHQVCIYIIQKQTINQIVLKLLTRIVYIISVLIRFLYRVTHLYFK